MSGLIQELKRRNVFKVGAAYVVLAWLLAQITDVFLEPFGAPDWVIKTVLLVLLIGFPLALFFAWAFEMTPEGIKKERDVDRSQSITTQTGRKLDFVIIFVLIIALGYFAYDKFVLEAERSAAAASTVAEAGSATPEPETVDRSIAVLPFVNMSDDKGNEYFSDGISEEILNALARVKELTPRGTHLTLEASIERINSWYVGWSSYFAMTHYPAQLRKIEAHIRRRLRSRLVDQQKSKRNLYRKLIKRGVSRRQAANTVFSNRARWALSHTFAASRAYPVGWFVGELGQAIRSNKQLPHWFDVNQWKWLSTSRKCLLHLVVGTICSPYEFSVRGRRCQDRLLHQAVKK